MNCYKVVTFSLQLVTCMSLLSVGSDMSYVALCMVSQLTCVTAGVLLCHLFHESQLCHDVC